jgi:polygalacturonase
MKCTWKISGLLFTLVICCTSANAQTDTSWNQLPVILSRIKAPVFPNNNFNILNYGAPTNGTSLSTTAINNAINACNAAGGGKVIIPPGTFLTGAIRLKSNVNLYISAGATLKFSTNTADYLPVVYTRFESVECYNFSPFIYAFQENNIAITGSGTVNGQATNTNWWAWKTSGAADVNSLNAMGENGTPVAQRIFGSGHKIRPNFIQPYRCTNVLIDSITIINSPMWEVNPVLCQNVTIRNLNINSHGPNNDGCDPECCKDVLIYNCTFNTGDDCIAIKSGRNNDGRRVNVPCENVVIQKCTMQDGHGGVTMGSECSGSIRNVFAENCNLNSVKLDIALRIKTNSVRGGIIENIFMRNCTIGQVASEVLQVDMQYQEGDAGSFTPIVRNIEMNNVTGSNCPAIFYFDCYQRSPVSNVKIMNCSFSNVTGNTLINVEKLQIYNTFSNGTVPLIPAPVTGYTHAETYGSKSDWGWSNVLTGFTGNSYMEPVTQNNFIEWNVNAANNETDTVVWTYANKNSVNKSYSLYVNSVLSSTVLFPPSSSNWKTLKIPYKASKGANVIRLVANDINSGVYFDRFSIIKGPTIITTGLTGKNVTSISLLCLPNFINYSADILLDLPYDDDITLDVFSLEGVKVNSIYSGHGRQGENTFKFNRNNLAAGMYLLKLSTSKTLITQKILITD